MSDFNFHRVILGVRDAGEGRNQWTQLGVTFLNKDGSENLKFNFFPTDPNMTIQLRDPKKADEKEEG